MLMEKSADFKISIFSSQDFDFFRTPEFLGFKYLIAVAIGGRTGSVSFFSVHEIPPGDPVDDLSPPLLCTDLSTKLPVNSRVMAIFDTRQEKRPWSWRGMKALEYSDNAPAAVTAGYNEALKFLELKFQERTMLAPDLPWQANQIEHFRESLSKKSYRRFFAGNDPQVATIIADLDRTKKILVHVCCGPDAAGVIDQLREDFDPVMFWYDPNIQPREEYQLRLDAFLKVAELKNVPVIVGEYDVDYFLKRIEGLESSPEQGAKCSICYDLRLERSAQEAKKQNCDLFTTTLAISPHKVQKKLQVFGDLAAKKYGVPYLARNFMKHDGFKESVQFTNENNIYRQQYCGCWFSLHEGGPDARTRATELGLTAQNIANKNYKLPE